MSDQKYKDKILKAIEEDKVGDPITVFLTSVGAAVTGQALTGTAALIVGTIVTVSTLVNIGFTIAGLVSGRRRQDPSFGGSGLSGGPRYQFGRLVTTTSNEIPIPVIYGEVKVAGNIMYQSDQSIVGDESRMFRAIGICEGTINAINSHKINDVAITQLTGSSSTEYLGTSSQTVDSRFSNVLDGLRYLAYSAATIQTSAKLRGGNPNHTFVVQGRKVKTWDGATWSGATYTKNPSACLRDFLTNDRYGVGIAESDIDDASFGAAYDYCADSIANPESGLNETRYELDIALDARLPAIDLLKEMLQTFAGYLVMSGSTIKLGVEKLTAVSQSFDEDSIVKSSFSYAYASKDDIANKVRIQYVDPTQNYTKVLTFAEDKIDQDDRLARGLGEHIIEQDFSLLGIARFYQASRIANLFLYSGKLSSLTVTFEVSIEALAAEVGDVINVTHSLPGWTNKPFRINKIDITENNTMKIACREYNASIYSDNPGTAISIPDYGSPPNPFEAPDPVQNISLEEIGWRQEDGTHIANVDITWSQPVDAQYLAGFKILVSKDGGSYEDAGYSQVGDNQFRYNNAEVGSEYQFQVFSISQEDLQSSGATSSLLTIVGKDAAPGPITNLAISQLDDSILFSWTSPTDPDIDYYEIRQGSSWGSGAILNTLIFGTQLQNHNVAIGTKTYWVKAVDRSGNYSNDAVGKSITISTIPNQNILATQNEHTSWTGTKTQTFVSGTALGIDWGFVSGNYVTPTIDVGSTVQAKVTVDYTITSSGISAWDSSPSAAFDTYSDLTWTGFESATNENIVFEISTSDDDSTYTDFESLQFGNYTARYYKIKAIVARNDVNDSILVSTMTTNIDVPDVIDTGALQSFATPTGTFVSYNKTFHVAPAVSITIIDQAGPGNLRTPIITHNVPAGFTALVRDSTDTVVSASGSWQAIGY